MRTKSQSNSTIEHIELSRLSYEFDRIHPMQQTKVRKVEKLMAKCRGLYRMSSWKITLVKSVSQTMLL